MVTRGWRSISDYKKMMQLPNVVLVHPNVKSEEMFKRCSLLISISGTSAFEVAFYNKPSIVFVDLGYTVLDSVYKLQTIVELPNAIRSSLEKKVDPSDLSKYVDFIHKNSFEVDWWGLLAEIHGRFYYGGFLSAIDIEIDKMKSFLKDSHSIFDQVAAEHIKKIKEFNKSKL